MWERDKLVLAIYQGDLLPKLTEVVQNAQVCDRLKEQTAQLWKILLGGGESLEFANFSEKRRQQYLKL